MLKIQNLAGYRIVMLRHLRLQERTVPKRSDYVNYIAPDKENYRGINAVRVLSRENNYTPAKLALAANDPYLGRF